LERIYSTLYTLFGRAVKTLPAPLLNSFLKTLSTTVTYTTPKFRRRVERNLRTVYGEEFAKKHSGEFTSSCIRNLLQNGVTLFKGGRQKVEFKNREVVDRLLKEGQPIIFSSAHYGNWELLASAIGREITSITAVAKKIRNREIDRLITERRESVGIKIVRSKGAVRQLAKAIKRGESIYIMADQSIRGGVLYPVFGKPAKQSVTNRFLVEKFGATVVPTYITKTEKNGYLAEFFEPMDSSYSGDIVEKEIEVLESMVNREPKNWLWCHNRWK
jgi:KDO2-lipid IV(A) lauroyltransferase